MKAFLTFIPVFMILTSNTYAQQHPLDTKKFAMELIKWTTSADSNSTFSVSFDSHTVVNKKERIFLQGKVFERISEKELPENFQFLHKSKANTINWAEDGVISVSEAAADTVWVNISLGLTGRSVFKVYLHNGMYVPVLIANS